MKIFFGDAQLEEARSCASPVKNITSCDRSLYFGVKKYVIFYVIPYTQLLPPLSLGNSELLLLSFPVELTLNQICVHIISSKSLCIRLCASIFVFCKLVATRLQVGLR
jgi:hypothetical protein